MLKKLSHLFVGMIVLVLLSMTLILNVQAEGEYTRNLSNDVSITVNGETIKGMRTNPASYYEDAAAGYLVSQQINYEEVNESDRIIYTAEYPKVHTERVGAKEYIAKEDSGKYYITEIITSSTGNTYIPVSGFVISLPATFSESWEIGDEVVINSDLTIPTQVVESDEYRIVVDKTNTTRSGPMVVYYDYQFGEKTGTNVYGTEMTCTYDFDLNTFVVKSFRGFGVGDASGSDIPDNSFVLSAYGEGYRGLLVRGELFNVGDHVKMVGFDFIRFGGTVTGSYDYVNPTPEINPKGMETESSPFPAYRGENQTIIYKYGWNYNGATGTGTNVYGYEAAVDESGVVVELNVNVSKIPENGYVISGHGSGRDFIRSNFVLGATVVLNETNQTYSISTTLNSYYENLVLVVNNAITTAQTKMKQLYDLDYEAIEQTIKDAQDKLAGIKIVKEQIEDGLASGTWSDEEALSHLMQYNSYQLEIEKYSQKLTSLSAESLAISAKAVWHRPTELSYEEIKSTMEVYLASGINLIFVETLYNGVSAFKTKYTSIFPYNTKLADSYSDGKTTYSDYLSCFVALAKEYGIEVHAWVENFYVGLLNTAEVIKNHPDWILYNDDDSYYQRNEGGSYIFIDPANTEVQDALINYYLDLFEKVPDCAGLNLDYIRYPVSDEAEDTGYTIAAMEGFAESKGMNFTETQKADRAKMAKKFKQLFDKTYLVGGEEEAEKNYEDWVSYRTNIISEYVRRIKKEVKDVKNIQLSTAVFASVTDSLDLKKQDWKTWINNGWIDIATPMAYYTDASDVLTNVNNMILSAGTNSFYYAGLASSYSGLPAYKNTEQIEAAYSGGASGYVIFCSTQIIGHTDVQEVLQLGVNSSTSILPHASVSEVLKASFDDILSKATRIYIPKGGMNQTQYDALEKEFNDILKMPTSTTIEIYKVQKAVDALYTNGISTYAKGYSGQRIISYLKNLSSNLDTQITTSMIRSGEWDPEQYPHYPEISEDGIKMVENTPDPTPDPDPTPTPNPTNKSSNVWIYIVIGAAVAAAAVTIVLVIKKKNKRIK